MTNDLADILAALVELLNRYGFCDLICIKSNQPGTILVPFEYKFISVSWRKTHLSQLTVLNKETFDKSTCSPTPECSRINSSLKFSPCYSQVPEKAIQNSTQQVYRTCGNSHSSEINKRNLIHSSYFLSTTTASVITVNQFSCSRTTLIQPHSSRLKSQSQSSTSKELSLHAYNVTYLFVNQMTSTSFSPGSAN